MIIPADRNSFVSYLEGRTAPMRDNFVTKRGECTKPIRNFLEPGRDRLGDHLEISQRDPEG
jgi:hypothetical protein